MFLHPFARAIPYIHTYSTHSLGVHLFFITTYNYLDHIPGRVGIGYHFGKTTGIVHLISSRYRPHSAGANGGGGGGGWSTREFRASEVDNSHIGSCFPHGLCSSIFRSFEGAGKIHIRHNRATGRRASTPHPSLSSDIHVGFRLPDDSLGGGLT